MDVEIIQDESSVTIMPTNEIKPVNIITTEYQDFPTDVPSSILWHMATQTNGTKY